MPFILPYKAGSASAKALSNSLGAKRIKKTGSLFKPLTRNGTPKVVINWGCTEVNPVVQGARILNTFESVYNACNKLNALTVLEECGVDVPKFTTDQDEAKTWLEQGKLVVERHLLRANSGRGIRIVDKIEDLQYAPLYTQYIKKQSEYRLHAMGGEVFDIQQKRRSTEVPDGDVNWQVRNTAGGFIFARDNVELQPITEEVKQMCATAVRSLGLDFGAVDLVYNKQQNKMYVLEINTACGLQGTTLEKYTDKFKEFLNV